MATTNKTVSIIANILTDYKSRDHFLGYKAAAAFEKDIVSCAKEGITFSEFKKIISFLESHTLDDSATGLEYLYEALNNVLHSNLTADKDKTKAKHWKWVKEHLLCENDFFLETLISIYTEDKYRAEILPILEKAVAAERAEEEYWAKLKDVDDEEYEALDELDDDDDCDDDEIEFYKHSGEYYIALCLKGTPDYEAYLDKCIQADDGDDGDASRADCTYHIDCPDDIKLLKKELLADRGENDAAFELLKSECVLEAAELLEGEKKEQYLFSQIMDGRETVVGQRRLWWDKLCETVSARGEVVSARGGKDEIDGVNRKDGADANEVLNRYMTTLMTSPKHCEMVNWKLYEQERFEELKTRIDTGWIYDDIWGKLNDDATSKFNAINGYTKLKKVYPEWYAQIMIDYAVFMMNYHKQRQYYKTSAKTIAAAGKIGGMEMAREVANELVEKYPSRKAMIEELKNVGLL